MTTDAFHYKKSLGQCFLRDKVVLAKIERVLSRVLDYNSVVVEIGPGLGALTKQILNLNVKDLLLIEKDLLCIKRLRNWLEKIDKHTNVSIIEKDIRKISLDSIMKSNYYIVANIPYYITGFLLADVFLDSEKLKSAFLMIQKEVFDKINSKVGERRYSYLSVLIQTFFDLDLFITVAPSSFYPTPKVFSVFCGFLPTRYKLNWPFKKRKYYKLFLKKAFSNRRKVLKNNLEEEVLDKLPNWVRMRRPQEISVEQWIEFFELTYTNTVEC